MFSGADFTNTFHLLSRVPWPEDDSSDKATVGPVVDLILDQCASTEELKVTNKPTMEEKWGVVWWRNMCHFNCFKKKPPYPPYTTDCALNTIYLQVVSND